MKILSLFAIYKNLILLYKNVRFENKSRLNFHEFTLLCNEN